MDQVRVIFATLFPALWVVASGQGFPQSQGGGLQVRCHVTISSRQAGRATSAKYTCEVAHPLRGLNRRVGVEFGEDDPFAASELPQGVYPRLSRIDHFSTENPTPHRLAKSWQFLWRTALEPRAPSSVS